MPRKRISYADIKVDSLYRDVDRLLDEMTPQEIRQAYTAARSTLQKRVARIEAAGLTSPATERFHATAPTLKQIDAHTREGNTTKFIARQLVRTLQTLEMPSASIQGVRKGQSDTIESLHMRGLDFVNMSNLSEFGSFMEYARATGLALLYDSDRIAESIRDYWDRVPEDHRTMEGWADAFRDFMQMDAEAESRQREAMRELRGLGVGERRGRVRSAQKEIRRRAFEENR